MKRMLLMTAVLLGSFAGAQSLQPTYQSRAGAPDLVTLETGYTTQLSHESVGQFFQSATYGRLYGNVTLSERFSSSYGKSVYGDLKFGNDWNDLDRLFIDGQVNAYQGDLNVYAGVRQGVFGSTATTIRVGVKVGF